MKNYQAEEKIFIGSMGEQLAVDQALDFYSHNPSLVPAHDTKRLNEIRSRFDVFADAVTEAFFELDQELNGEWGRGTPKMLPSDDERLLFRPGDHEIIIGALVLAGKNSSCPVFKMYCDTTVKEFRGLAPEDPAMA
jgi:hypothetical protein